MLEYFLTQTWLKKWAKNSLLLLILWAPESHFIPLTTKTDIKVEQYVTCVNALSNPWNDFYYTFYEVR